MIYPPVFPGSAPAFRVFTSTTVGGGFSASRHSSQSGRRSSGIPSTSRPHSIHKKQSDGIFEILLFPFAGGAVGVVLGLADDV